MTNLTGSQLNFSPKKLLFFYCIEPCRALLIMNSPGIIIFILVLGMAASALPPNDSHTFTVPIPPTTVVYASMMTTFTDSLCRIIVYNVGLSLATGTWCLLVGISSGVIAGATHMYTSPPEFL
jgi:hypothetical protein